MREHVRFFLKMTLTFTIAMVLLELFLRFSATTTPSVLVDDDMFGKMMKPSTDVTFVNEGLRIGRINRYGYLGPAYAPRKEEGTVRIALMGDSYVAGHHLFDRHHFRYLLEQGLNQLCDSHVEVLNFGFPALNFEQMYLYYEVFARKFAPDFVIYVIGTSSLNQPSDEVGPRLVVTDDSVHISYAFRSSKRFAISKRLSPLKRLALYSLLRKGKQIYDRGDAPKVIFDKFFILARGSGRSAEKHSVPVERPERKAINRAIVRQLGMSNREGGPVSIIVTRGELPRGFVEFAKNNGVAVWDPSARLDSLARSGIDPNWWAGSQRKGHWNQYAHRVIGDFLVHKMLPFIKSLAKGQKTLRDPDRAP